MCYRGSMRAIAEKNAQEEPEDEVEPNDDRDDIELDETEQALTDLPMEAI